VNGRARRRVLWQAILVSWCVLGLTWLYGWHPAAGCFASVCALVGTVLVQIRRHR
jgi:sterol desaturase/sphingolipid hydroxylase (fatty acid hydroxylase superfamily)